MTDMTDWTMGKLWEVRSQNIYNSLENNDLFNIGSTYGVDTHSLFPLILRGVKLNKSLSYNKLQDSKKSLHFENGSFCYGKTMGKVIWAHSV